ncbi:GNAT family N-acetyltransferase [Alkalibacterium pelagium]|uniref:Acetyltransferase (GNAT) domain-containing protein n=1 Tax=Alkalibacterium pelagium TaxID=426702 RepID=A0A1H7HUN4_9LACT|nr:GNAT family N-acetyltransferase [Alkalibacterium pelagium]GEN50392.1 hypothetical protein APE02nite_10570 [Alkalibacterium pelagium]SEK51905.1 Acetyltransferase (GNAT) domain-containing protein [Alkalibacterium pelagium]
METEKKWCVSNQPFYKKGHWPERVDPGYSIEYAQLYEVKESGTAERFSYKSEKGRVDHVYIKRMIPFILGNDTYYDITTPYGYGGPVIIYGEDTEGLLKEYYQAFHAYCIDQRIVSEFVRFHLFESNNVREQYYGEVSLVGAHIVNPLCDPLKSDMSSDVKRSLRKAEKLGMTIHFDTTGENIDQFLAIYCDMLIRNQASSYYYFDREFFDDLHKKLKGRFVYVFAEIDGTIISLRLALYGSRYGFGFLGGTLKEFFHTQATTVVDYHILEFLKTQDCSYFSFGGGINGNDGIYKYKTKFNRNGDHPSYVGKKIHLPEVYDLIVSKRSELSPFDPDTSFFPLYRS